MNTLRRSALAIAIALGGAALSLPATASNVAWSVSVGGPGFAVNAGQPAYGHAWRSAYRPVVRPYARPVPYRSFGYGHAGFRPVVVAPRVWVAPQPVYYAPRPVFAPRVVVAPRPYASVNAYPYGNGYGFGYGDGYGR